MDDQVQIQVRFTIERNGLTFSDALYFGVEEYKAITKAQLTVLKNQRFAAFRQALKDAQNAPQADPMDAIIALDNDMKQRRLERKQRLADAAQAKGVSEAVIEAQVAAQEVS